MTEHQTPAVPGSNSSLNEHPAIGNLRSLDSFLSDVIHKINHQVLGNAETLEFMEIQEIENLIGKEAFDKIAKFAKGFNSQRVDILVKSPLRQIVGRLRGFQRVLKDIEKQIKSNQATRS